MAAKRRTVEEIVDALLGSHATEMSARERREAVRAFEEAGKAAVQIRTGKVRDAAEAVRRSRRLLGDARVAIASTARDAGPHLLVDREWDPVHRALRAEREMLCRISGVIGTGIGHRRRGMARTSERTVVAYVRRKMDPDELARSGGRVVPKTLRSGQTEIATDVVELGEFRPQMDAGGTLGPQAGGTRGTLGVFGEEKGTGRPVGFTANHVTGRPGPFPPGDPLTLCAPFGGPVLGELLRGRDAPVDAAAVAVVPPAAASRRIAGIGEIRGRRPVTSGDIDGDVRMFGAKSRLVPGALRDPAAEIDGLNVRPAILVEMSTQDGDSGAALVDDSQIVLGLLAGRFEGSDGLAVFSPIISVLRELGCIIRTT
jgi:hypothetical protein